MQSLNALLFVSFPSRSLLFLTCSLPISLSFYLTVCLFLSVSLLLVFIFIFLFLSFSLTLFLSFSLSLYVSFSPVSFFLAFLSLWSVTILFESVLEKHQKNISSGNKILCQLVFDSVDKIPRLETNARVRSCVD